MYRQQKQRGSRARRTGLSRTGERVLRDVLTEPLPEDRDERWVEEKRRSWLKAAWSDQRFPMNKRRANDTWRAYEGAVVLHLKRTHGVELTADRYYGITSWKRDGENADPRRVHDGFHPEEDA